MATPVLRVPGVMMSKGPTEIIVRDFEYPPTHQAIGKAVLQAARHGKVDVSVKYVPIKLQFVVTVRCVDAAKTGV